MVEVTHDQLKLMLTQAQARLRLAGEQLLTMQRQKTTMANTIQAFVQPIQLFLAEHGQVKDGEKLPLGSALLLALRTCAHNAKREVVPPDPDPKVIAP